jgi:hypothetical protein
VLRTGDPEILQALCNGEIKIDRAWRWSKESRGQQRENLKRYRPRNVSALLLRVTVIAAEGGRLDPVETS